MDAPSWICRKLAEFHPGLRLGWSGEENKFGLLMVSRRRMASQKMFTAYWDRRGPVFSKSGRPCPDWDELGHVPMYLSAIEPEDVFSGRVLRTVKRWARPIAARVYESTKEASLNVESRMEDICHEAGSKLYKQGQADGAGAPIVAKKFIEPTENMERMRNGEFDLSNKLVPPAPRDGWAPHLEADQGDADVLGKVGT